MTIDTLQGCGTALVTPFQEDGRVDEAALAALVDFQTDAGIDFLVPCGTTGETPTLTADGIRRAPGAGRSSPAPGATTRGRSSPRPASLRSSGSTPCCR